MSKHHNSDFNWNEHEAIHSSKQVNRILYNQLNTRSTTHNIKEAIWFIAALLLLTSPLWIQATGFIKG